MKKTGIFKTLTKYILLPLLLTVIIYGFYRVVLVDRDTWGFAEGIANLLVIPVFFAFLLLQVIANVTSYKWTFFVLLLGGASIYLGFYFNGQNAHCKSEAVKRAMTTLDFADLNSECIPKAERALYRQQVINRAPLNMEAYHRLVQTNGPFERQDCLLLHIGVETRKYSLTKDQINSGVDPKCKIGSLSAIDRILRYKQPVNSYERENTEGIAELVFKDLNWTAAKDVLRTYLENENIFLFKKVISRLPVDSSLGKEAVLSNYVIPTHLLAFAIYRVNGEALKLFLEKGFTLKLKFEKTIYKNGEKSSMIINLDEYAKASFDRSYNSEKNSIETAEYLKLGKAVIDQHREKIKYYEKQYEIIKNLISN